MERNKESQIRDQGSWIVIFAPRRQLLTSDSGTGARDYYQVRTYYHLQLVKKATVSTPPPLQLEQNATEFALPITES